MRPVWATLGVDHPAAVPVSPSISPASRDQALDCGCGRRMISRIEKERVAERTRDNRERSACVTYPTTCCNCCNYRIFPRRDLQRATEFIYDLGLIKLGRRRAIFIPKIKRHCAVVSDEDCATCSDRREGCCARGSLQHGGGDQAASDAARAASHAPGWVHSGALKKSLNGHET
jgi:hypothetical protein